MEDKVYDVFISYRRDGGDMTAMQLLLTVQSVLKRSLEDSEVSALMHRCGLEDPLSVCTDRELLRRRVADLCVACLDRLGENRREGVSYLCDQALQIIEQNYMDEDLSLNAVSERLHVSPNYLSANMKKYAGDTFINLLIRERMEHALQILQQSGSVRIAEVASACGYSDQHYFSYCFKKYHGISPARLRRSAEAEETV